MLTPPEVARRLRVNPDKVLRWIRSGELRAVNLAAGPAGRPRWRVDAADLAVFDARRSARPAPAARRRKRPAEVIEYF
jgi:excisionase family DNA binding protein